MDVNGDSRGRPFGGKCNLPSRRLHRVCENYRMPTPASPPLLSRAALRASARIGWLADTRLFEFVMGTLLVIETAIAGLPLIIPVRYLAMGLLVAVALNRRPAWTFQGARVYIWVSLLVLANFAAVSAMSPHPSGASDWVQRFVRLVLLFLFTSVAATGRVHLPSIIRGFALGLVLNAILFYAGAAPHDYQGFLTGYAGDKNSAALLYAVGGLLLMTTQRSWRIQLLTLLFFGVLTFLTGSRTTLAGLVAGVIWFALLSRRSLVVRAVGAAVIWWVLGFVEQNLSQLGIYADRTGTDWFRRQIAAAVSTKIAVTPFQGSGLGEAYVVLPQGHFYFHDAYATLRVEGGYLALIVVVAMTILIGMCPFRKTPPSQSARLLEGATIVLLVSAAELGEVFLTVSWALVMAGALRERFLRKDTEDQQKHRSQWVNRDPLTAGRASDTAAWRRQRVINAAE